jgi:addiction module HigA family antidote
MAKRAPKYEAFPPGDLIRREIEYRGWTQGDLARIMGRPLQVINQIINGSKAITARTALELEAALGPEAQFWMNLETSWRLYVEAKADPQITVRAKQSSQGIENRHEDAEKREPEKRIAWSFTTDSPLPLTSKKKKKSTQ